MERDDRVLLLGEDIGAYGGAFKVTAGMLERFGPERVIDTPISESAIVGAAIGAAYMGMRPVVEMQFIDFISCAFDQIVNQRLSRATAGEPGSIVIRGPSGGGVHGGPFHSRIRDALRAHAGAEGRRAVHRLRCERADQGVHPGRRPGDIPRAQVPLSQDQGNTARGGFHCAPRQSRYPRRGRGMTVVSYGAMVHVAWRPQRNWPGKASTRGHRPAHAAAAGQGPGARVGQEEQQSLRAARGHADGRDRREICAIINEEAFDYLDGRCFA